MTLKSNISPILTTSAIYIGCSDCYVYNNDGSKTLDANNIYLKFATAMLRVTGVNSEVLPIEQIISSLDENSNSSSISCKILSKDFEASKYKPGSKGILHAIPMAVSNNIYYKLIDFVSKNNNNVPVLPPVSAASVSK